jgi:uncharacterized protein involved in exopolysaccharide biosynthesis
MNDPSTLHATHGREAHEPAAAGPAASPESRDGDPLAGLLALGRHKVLLLACPFAAMLLTAAATLAMPNRYVAVTRILTPQQAQSTAVAMLNQLGGGNTGALAANALGVKNPNELYIALLKSDTISDAIVARFGLKGRYKAKYDVDARQALRGDTTVGTDRGGIIAVSVEDTDPKAAADIANAYVDELYKLTCTLAVTEASQRRLFFERQLQQAKDRLADAEVALRKAMQAGGIVSVDVQGRATVENVARLRAQVSAKEVQIGAMRVYAAPSNPELLRAEQEVTSLRKELAKLESGPPDAGTASAEVDPPARGVNNIRLLREVKYNEVMFELLAKQYDLARADESRDAPIIQVLDRATPPEKKSRPKRLSIVLTLGVLAFFATTATVLVRHAFERASANPDTRSRMAELKASWRLTRRRSR